MNWEPVYQNDHEIMERAAVEGGWLYRLQQRFGSEHSGYRWTMALAFVPTPTPTEPPP